MVVSWSHYAGLLWEGTARAARFLGRGKGWNSGSACCARTNEDTKETTKTSENWRIRCSGEWRTGLSCCEPVTHFPVCAIDVLCVKWRGGDEVTIDVFFFMSNDVAVTRLPWGRGRTAATEFNFALALWRIRNHRFFIYIFFLTFGMSLGEKCDSQLPTANPL